MDTSGDLSSQMDPDAYRRLFPLRYFEQHLSESIRPDGRPLDRARETIVALGAVASANGSALSKIGSTNLNLFLVQTMLAAIKLEVMTPSIESPDEGCIDAATLTLLFSAIDFHMPPSCSPLDIYCLDADGALFDAALLSAVGALSHLQIPVVSVNDDGRIILLSEEDEVKLKKEPLNKEKRKLSLNKIPFSLTCILHKNYILADPTAEEESIMETSVTVVLDSSSRIVSFYKPGGAVLASTSTVQDCVALTRQRANELQAILDGAISDMEVD
ncbi:hypothetical protein Tsubulata_013322 [Turnera subulata]|uniref:Exoribonuclease phosphorolytic domain-containing protein n=1 Tax=Turnera subulata TaxID=218843 RepID=A0A9Q0G6B3_9ROSI|nr:hypothetical protein Tsubulata_013322 [Turnera subulata]